MNTPYRIAASLFALAFSQAALADRASIHDDFEAERMRTDGNVDPRAVPVRLAGPATPHGDGHEAAASAADRHFRAQLALTDGNVDPAALDADAGPRLAAGLASTPAAQSPGRRSDRGM